MHIRVVGLAGPGQRVERQAITNRRVARHQETTFAAQKPRPALPARRAGFTARHWQHIADYVVEAVTEHLGEPLALHFIVQAGIERVNIDRQLALAPQVVPNVFERREHVLRIERQFFCDAGKKCLRLLRSDAVISVLIGKQ